MHIHWQTKQTSYTSLSNQLKEEYSLRRRLISRLLPFVEDDNLVNFLDDLELCYNEEDQSFAICNLASKSSQFIFKHLTKKQLALEFNICSVCSKG